MLHLFDFSLFFFDTLLINGFLLDKLNPLLSSPVQTLLMVLDHHAEHLGDDIQIAHFCKFLKTIEILFALLQLAELLNGITVVLILAGSQRKYLVGDGVETADLLDKLFIVFGGILHSFLMLLDELVALLKRFLVAQKSLLVLLDDIFRVAVQHLDFCLA